MRLALLPVSRQVVIRALLWALIGAIYAPLFTVLAVLFAPALGSFAMAGAAAVSGAVGAAYYSARQAALAASLVGVISALFVLLAFHEEAAFWHAALLAAGLGLVTGLLVDFPSRCTSNVLAKALAGGAVGALSGALLSLVALVGGQVSPVVAVAFLVSVNGVVYVASLRRIAAVTAVIPCRWCPLTEGLLIALVAVIVAGSLWAFATALGGYVHHELFPAVIEATSGSLPLVIAGGFAAGGITGALLQLFGFEWIDDL